MAYYIGLMSGTSLDGCDAALVEINQSEIRLVAYDSLPMPEALRERILRCCSLEDSDIRLVCSLNVELGYYFAKAARLISEKSGVPLCQVEAIGSHGQTVFHQPTAEQQWAASTLQLGEPAVIAYETKVKTVSSFRAMDMAAGGSGAPLVPYPEYLLYRAPFGRALQNLGGIGNVTVLPGNGTLDQLIAFDTGPGNMIIDSLCRRFLNRAYDENGAYAAQGAVNEALLAQWMSEPFLMAPPPKATGRELFGEQFVTREVCAHPEIKPLDFIATATRFTVESMLLHYRRFVFPYTPIEEVVLSGGGSHNQTIFRWLSQALPNVRVITQESLGWNSDAKEAVAFAILASETLKGHGGNAPGATGALERVILGNITPAPTPLAD